MGLFEILPGSEGKDRLQFLISGGMIIFKEKGFQRMAHYMRKESGPDLHRIKNPGQHSRMGILATLRIHGLNKRYICDLNPPGIA